MIKIFAQFIILFILITFQVSTFADTNSHAVDSILSFQRIAQVAPSPDGKQTAFVSYYAKSTRTGLEWEYSLNLTSPQGKISSLIKKNKIASISWLPNSNKIAYLAKGKKFQSIWVMNIEQHSANKLFEFNADITSYKWSPNGNFIAFSAAEEKNNSDLPVDVSPSETPTRLFLIPTNHTQFAAQQLTPAGSSISQFFVYPGFDWAPDSQSIAFAYQPQVGAAYALQNKIGIINLKTHEIKNIPYTEQHNSNQPNYSPDGKWIAFQANASQDEATKKLPGVKSNKLSPVLATMTLSTTICVANTETLETHCLANTPNENPALLGWNANNDTVFALDAFQTTGYQIYALGLEASQPAINLSKVNGFIEPLTISLNNSHTLFGFGYETVEQSPQAVISPVNPFHLEPISPLTPTPPIGKAQIIHWQSVDGMNIEGLLVTPINFDYGKLYPVLVAVHGGPSGAWAKRFLGGCDEYEDMIDPTTCWSTFLNLGFIILEPNPRGSTGYGSEFRLANFADLGGKDYQDIMTGVDALVQHGIADPDHLAIVGWSYGGYLTAWTIGHSNRFKAAVDGDGNTDWVSFNGTSNLSFFTPSYFGSTFWQNPFLYQERSPIYYINNMTTPLLIIHGEKDTRVPLSQSDELYHALKQQNKSVKMLMLPNQDHVPTDPNILSVTIHEIDEWVKQAL